MNAMHDAGAVRGAGPWSSGLTVLATGGLVSAVGAAVSRLMAAVLNWAKYGFTAINT
jgi:hypothetical protein